MNSALQFNPYNGNLSSFIDSHYLPHYADMHPKDFKNEIRRIDIIKLSEFAEMSLQTISHNDIAAFLHELQNKRNLAKATINRYRSRISAIMNYALDMEYILSNPVKKIKKYKEKPRTRALSIYEINSLLEACRASKNRELYTIVVLALNTGMRKGEILSIKLSNINIKNRNIYLERSYTKSGESRWVPLNDAAADVLSAYMADSDGPRLFKSKCIRNAFESAMYKAGIEQARFHDLRRTFATHLKDGGISLHTIMHLLGHSSISMTERYLATQDTILFDGVAKINFN